MGEASYIAAARIPPDCPPSLDLDLPAGFDCHITRSDNGEVSLTLGSPAIPDEWTEDSALAAADWEAERIVAVLCFQYIVPYRAPVRQRPVNPNRSGPWSYDLRCITCADEWPEQTAVLRGLLPSDDPRQYPLWQVLTSVGGLGDPLSQYVALWGILDIGLEATTAEAIDDYLSDHFDVAKDCSNRRGTPNAETKFAHFRHQVSHPWGRSVEDVALLSGAAGPLVCELIGYCRRAIREGFAKESLSDKASEQKPGG